MVTVKVSGYTFEFKEDSDYRDFVRDIENAKVKGLFARVAGKHNVEKDAPEVWLNPNDCKAIEVYKEAVLVQESPDGKFNAKADTSIDQEYIDARQPQKALRDKLNALEAKRNKKP